ncbi:MAG: NB-ARC domain-containing protein, partial [Ktedonobacteraceae bacterium]
MESTNANAPTANGLVCRNVVCLYSQVDEPFYLQLKKSLNLLERQGQVQWLEVLSGAELALTWQRNVKCADLILFLLSPDFFVDELCYQTMLLVLQERTSRQVPAVPILVRAVNWRLSACKDLAIVPHNEQPVASWPFPDEAYAFIGADLACLVPGWPPIPLPTRPRLFQARELPKGYVPRPKAFDEIKGLLLSQRSTQTAAITTALRGAGGFGKTTLALALCHDSEIQAAFPDGILWVELGEQPPKPIDVLNGVLAFLEPSLSEATTLEKARYRWRTALDGRMCLLIIDDVWQAHALEPLLEGGPQCARLVTTRNDQVLPEETARVWVDAMETEEAIAMLRRGLPEEVQQSALEALVIRLGCWPLLLTLAHGLLLDQVCYGRTVAQALEVVEHVYQQRGVAAFHLEQLRERYQTVERCLEVSLQHLEDFTLVRYQAATRYQELAIFPEDTDIPIALLHIFWQGTGGLETWETDELCVRLHQLSLLLTCDLGKGTIRLHDVMHNYL